MVRAQVEQMLPRIGEGLQIQPSLTQLAAMARADPGSLEQVRCTGQGTVLACVTAAAAAAPAGCIIA